MADEQKNGAIDEQDAIDLHYETMEPGRGSVPPGDARHRAHPARSSTASVSCSRGRGRLPAPRLEKECESGLYYRRSLHPTAWNYVSPMINNVGYALAVEKLFGVEVPALPVPAHDRR